MSLAHHNTANEEIVRRSRAAMRTAAKSIANFELPAFETVQGTAPEAAGRIISEARTTAQQMVDQARSAAASEIEVARKRGYEAGFIEGLESADRETAGLIHTAEAIATNVAREREHLLVQSEQEIVDLAMTIAQRLVNAELEARPELVIDVCRGAMRKAFQRETLVVLAHPEDLEMLRAAGPEMARELGGIHQLDFVEERRLQRGSVIVRTPVGEIDATFDSKSEKIAESLKELAQTRRAEVRVLADGLGTDQAAADAGA